MSERPEPGNGGARAAGSVEMERLERLAAQVEDEGAAPVDEREREILGRMRAVRDALREAGPAHASAGFTERVLARMGAAQEEARVVRLRVRRDRIVVFAQAASLAALLVVYGALLAATRVHDVGSRWSDTPAAGTARPDAGPSAQAWPAAAPAVALRDAIPLRISVATPTPLALDSTPPPEGGGEARWNSRCSASPMSDSSASITKTRTS
jgi:hypothetical protein